MSKNPITRADLIANRDRLEEQIRYVVSCRGDAALAIAEAGGKDAAKRLAELDTERAELTAQRDAVDAAIEAFDRRAAAQAEVASIGQHEARARETMGAAMAPNC